ncbi:MAG: hypothetical protein AAF420_02435 [Pseudomonadota bacterium]
MDDSAFSIIPLDEQRFAETFNFIVDVFVDGSALHRALNIQHN